MLFGLISQFGRPIAYCFGGSEIFRQGGLGPINQCQVALRDKKRKLVKRGHDSVSARRKTIPVLQEQRLVVANFGPQIRRGGEFERPGQHGLALGLFEQCEHEPRIREHPRIVWML
ncbi:MAG: hypothetical protein R6X02_27290 [Enhygromyxa sp.]